MEICTLHRGTAPLLVSLPHDGTLVPDDIAARLTPQARRVPDTDWHIARLYAFARGRGAAGRGGPPPRRRPRPGRR